MTDLLVKAKQLLKTWNKDDIQDLLVDMTTRREQLDYDSAKTEIEFDLYRIERYEHYKKLKVDGKIKRTDTECDKESKKDALVKYWDQLLRKKIANHYKENIDQLKQRKIDISTRDKELREAWL